MLNNKFKKNNKILWMSFSFLIIASCLMVILNILGIVLWNQNHYQTTQNLIACNCGLILPIYIVGIIFYFFVDNKLTQKWLIILIIISVSFSIIFILLGAILFLISNINTKTAGMWILIIGTFGTIFISFWSLIYYLHFNYQQKQNFEKIIKDPKE